MPSRRPSNGYPQRFLTSRRTQPRRALRPTRAIMLPQAAEGLMPGQRPFERQLSSQGLLSGRTIETLSMLPSSPAVKERCRIFLRQWIWWRRRPPSRPASRSSRPSSRPGSSHQSDGSNRPPSRASGRPSSSSGADEGVSNFRASINTYKNTLSTINDTPLRGGQPPVSQIPVSTNFSLVPLVDIQDAPSGIHTVEVPKPRQSRPARRLSLALRLQDPSGATSETAALVEWAFQKPSLQALDRSASAVTPRKASTASRDHRPRRAETNPSTSASVSTAITN